jgi:hypothetical protein
VIDDEKTFPFPDDWDVIYARTLKTGFAELANADALDELWLDHDLGGEDTIRPLVLSLAEAAFNGAAPRIGVVVICSLNPVGQKWMESTLIRFKVRLCINPEMLLERLGSKDATWY